MGVDHAERRRLLAEMHQDAGEHRMLENVGKVAGVEGVTVVHRAFLRPAQQPAKYATGVRELWRMSLSAKPGHTPRIKTPDDVRGLLSPERIRDQPRTRGINT